MRTKKKTGCEQQATAIDLVHLCALAALYGATEAFFEPFRFGDEVRANHSLAQLAYKTRGVPWHVGGGVDAERKSAERVRNDLADAKLVTIFRNKTKIVGASLTEAGMRIATDAVGANCLADAAVVLDRLHGLEFDGDSFVDGVGSVWVNECALAGTSYDQTNNKNPNHKTAQQKLGDALGHLLPALIAGIVFSNSDLGGRIWFSLRKRGADLPSKRLPKNHRTLEWHSEQPDDDVFRAYEHGYDVARSRLSGPVLVPGHCGMIAISCRPPLRKFKNMIGMSPVTTPTAE